MNILPGELTVFSNEMNGGFTFLPFGNHSIELDLTNIPNWELTTGSSSFNFSLDENDPTDSISFGIYPLAQISEMNTAITTGNRRCNTVAHFNVYAENTCLLYTSPSPRDQRGSRMPSSA